MNTAGDRLGAMSMLGRSCPLMVATAFLVASAGAAHVAVAQPAPLAGFDAYVAQAVRDWKAPGLAIAVVKDGEIVFSKGYGVRRLGSPEAVDDRTLFAIGSTIEDYRLKPVDS